MAARSVYKLLCSTLHSSRPKALPAFRSVASGGDLLKKPLRAKSCEKQDKRSFSQPSRTKILRVSRGKENFIQVRTISRSLDNLKGRKFTSKYDEEEDQEVEVERPQRRESRYLRNDRDRIQKQEPEKVATKQVFEEEELEDEIQFKEAGVRYEISGSSKSKVRNYYNVYNYFTDRESNRKQTVFPHLQPNNLKPFGANDNLFFPEVMRTKAEIIYPFEGSVEATYEDAGQTNRKIDNIQHKDFSSYRGKEYPGLEDSKKMAVFEKLSKHRDINKKNYSTVCSNVSNKTKAGESFSGQVAKSCSKKAESLKNAAKVTETFSVKKSFSMKVESPRNAVKVIETVSVKTKACDTAKKSKNISNEIQQVSSDILEKARKSLVAKKSEKKIAVATSSTRVGSGFLNKKSQKITSSRNYNTYAKDAKNRDYMTLKLSDLQCKPKKVKKLTKFVPMDCPCVEETPLKEAKRLVPLKKRFTYPDRTWDCESKVCDTPRADAGLEIKKKVLPKIEMAICPCIKTELTDFTIKRLPKRKIPEPPKICVECVGEECCPPRADSHRKVVPKKLPVLAAPDCPCYDPPELDDVPLRRLKPNPVEEPERVCPQSEICEPQERADNNLKVAPKVLLKLEFNNCPCVDLPGNVDVPKLKRLKKPKYEEKPREVCEEIVCTEKRADDDLRFKKKKLPIFKPQNCPCVEPEPLMDVAPLKRLTPCNRPVAVKEICVEEVCQPRADDGLKLKPKKLPEIIPGECPCIEFEMEDVPPLPRLKPNPVMEPPKICIECVGEECCPPRADAGLKAKSKKLPYLAPSNCPCYDPEPPKDVAPLKKLKAKPVKEPERVCKPSEECPPRADDNLKVVAKTLPKLEINNCPCVDPDLDEDVPALKRLKKVHISEPPKICVKTDDCDEAVRADEDDWLYWKKCEAVIQKDGGGKPMQNTCDDINYCSKREYSTSASKRNFDLDFRPPLLTLDLVKKTGAEIFNLLVDVKPTKSESPVTSPIDYVSFVVYKSKKDNSKDASKSNDSIIFNSITRFISTSTTLTKFDDKELQPNHPMIKQLEKFIPPFPGDDMIEASRMKSRKYLNERVDSGKSKVVEEDEEEESCGGIKDNIDNLEKLCNVDENVCAKEVKLSLWQRLLNFFKARPNCPSPEEFKKMRLREDAKKAAAKAGLALYDPAEQECNKLPKVITADCDEDDDRRRK